MQKYALISTIFFAVPFVASAQTIQQLLGEVLDFFNAILVPLVFAFAFLVFIWNVLRFFILQSGTAEGQERAKRFMVWSIVAFVLMLTLWGIVNLIANGFGISGNGTICPDYNPACKAGLPFTPTPDCNPTNPLFPNC